MFITGISGQFYRQFDLTITGATIISLIVSLTLSPAMCALLLKPHAARRHERWWERLVDSYIHSELLFLKLPMLFLFPLARRLKWIHTPAAGVEHLLYPSLRHSDVLLTNSRGIAADAMASR